MYNSIERIEKNWKTLMGYRVITTQIRIYVFSYLCAENCSSVYKGPLDINGRPRKLQLTLK